MYAELERRIESRARRHARQSQQPDKEGPRRHASATWPMQPATCGCQSPAHGAACFVVLSLEHLHALARSIEPDKDVQRLQGHLSDGFRSSKRSCTRPYTETTGHLLSSSARVCSQACEQPLDPETTTTHMHGCRCRSLSLSLSLSLSDAWLRALMNPPGTYVRAPCTVHV